MSKKLSSYVWNQIQSGANDRAIELRQERRDKKRAAKKSKMTQHGKSIAVVYKKSVEKRAGKKKPQ